MSLMVRPEKPQHVLQLVGRSQASGIDPKQAIFGYAQFLAEGCPFFRDQV